MKSFRVAAAALVCLILAVNSFGQTGNASVGGFVQDATQAFIPGATVTATNTATGVARTVLTNESGAYSFPSLQPGSYKVSAELSGFQTQTFTNVELGNAEQVRLNFTLRVASVNTAVEVSVPIDTLLATSSSTIGEVLPEYKVRDLPMVGNDVLNLINTMAGVRGGTGSEATTFAGISAGMVNTVRDGLSVQDGRYLDGVFGTTVINPELVGEMRVILAPVDAEMGRGNGQVQIQTRSGTNKYSGTAVWSVRNSKLDANTWTNNQTIVNGAWKPTPADWFNKNEYTLAYGGPIVKNKTFFFALWEQRFENDRTTQRPVVLTDCARNGIFRYFDGWVNGNINTTTSTTGATPTRAVVDSSGNPVTPPTNPNGTPFSGQLRYFSVFGPLVKNPTKPDCSDAVVQGASWDPFRTAPDSTGLIKKYLDAMPHANLFDGGDGLNTAVNQWLRGARSGGSLAIGAGTDVQTDRRQINLKVDHNFNPRHKASVNWSYEWTDGDNSLNTWPGGYGGLTSRRPAVFTANLTSTLTPTLLNEARVGWKRNWLVIQPAWERTDDQKAHAAGQSLLIQGTQGFPIVFVPSVVGGMNPANYICMSPAFNGCAEQGNTSPLKDFADTISWTKGKHAFKGGVDVRMGHSNGWASPTAPIPQAQGGAGLNPVQAFQNTTNFPGLVSTNQTLANQLLYFLAGSVNNAQQVYFLQSSKDLTKWENYKTVDHKYIDVIQNEFDVFLKDDWKVRPSLTLNLGLRYEYYGVPFEAHGLATAPVGGGIALFGVSGRSFDRWMRPDAGVDPSLVTTSEFVGPHTVNPGKSLYKDDWNNFGPAIGFAWQLPWFGKGKTNIRGGYQITYSGGGRAQPIDNFILSNPGFQNFPSIQNPPDGSYFDLRNLPSVVPVPPSTLPMQPIPVQKQNQAAAAFDYNYATPYVQNFTLSVTRDVRRNINVDVRYIGTRGLKLYGGGGAGSFDLNSANVFYNPVLFDALDRTRRGENVLLFDQMLLGLNINAGVAGSAAVNGTTQRGSEHLRLNSTFQTALANGDYATVAAALNTYNGSGAVGVGTVAGVGGERGTVLRRANQGFNVPGGISVPGASLVVPAGLFPENWISSNPQFSQANFYTNSGSSIYHSLQTQVTIRPTHGMSFQGTYVFSKSLGVPGGAYTNPVERERDYTLATSHRTHDFRGNGIFELPIGPNKLLLANSSGWLARAVEHWQTGLIVNINSGAPTSITAGNMLYANGVADVVAPFDARTGTVHWGDPGASQLVGGYFATGTYGKVVDPQCNNVADSLKRFCTLQAVTDAKTGQIVLQNPLPGKRGTLGRNTIELPGAWSFDANLSKRFKITESKDVQLRFDAQNVFNHPNPGTPSLSINSTNAFGLISSKTTDHRQFQGQLRFGF
jgi:hypothetical protein